MSKIIKNGIVYGETLLPAAGNIAYDNTASGLNATTMQNAITELKDMYDLPKGYAWAGTQAQWDAMTASEKAVYDGKIIAIIDDIQSRVNIEETVLFLQDFEEFTPESGNSDKTRTYTLSESINNFDAIQVFAYAFCEVQSSKTVCNQLMSTIILPSMADQKGMIEGDAWEDCPFLLNGTASDKRRLLFGFTDDETIKTIANRSRSNEESVLYKVVGLKFQCNVPAGSGGGIDYSTTEQDTGKKWIDGKPIYQISTLASSSDLFDVNTLSIDKLIKVEAFGSDNSGYTGSKWTIEGVSGSSNRLIYWSSSSGKIVYEGNFPLYAATIWYTKTTDTAE